MIRKVLRTIARFLSSAGLAVALLVFVGVWSMLATVIAQGQAVSPAVASWAAAYPFFEPLVRVLGLHNAFSSHVFLGVVLLLGISTSVCAWRRTKVAVSRSAALRSAARADRVSIVEGHDLEIAADPDLGGPEVLSLAADVLERHGIATKGREELLKAVSAPWSVWGSPIFHWALVAMMVVVLAGQSLRSEGSMTLAVSEAKRDQPASYLSLESGWLRNWSRVDRSIRLDAFDPDYKTGGIDRGAVPTVSVLDGAGTVVDKQRVYPNSMLHSGSLAINAPAVGLSAWFIFLDSRGVETGRMIQYLDFSQTATDGTVPVRKFARTNTAGETAMGLYATVPLDRYRGGYGEWIPVKPSARLVVTAGAGAPLLDRIVHPGEDVPLPGGGSIRLLGVGWYSRLSLVDDPTIPLVYASMIIAILGLTMTLVFRQQLLVAAVVEGPEGPKLVMRLRLWRNAPTSRDEIRSELERALGTRERGGTS